MNRAPLVVALVLALPSLAHAQAAEPPPTTVSVTAPAGWGLDGERTAAQARSLRAQAHLGGSARATAAAYRSSPAGALLVVSELVAEPAPVDAVSAARTELTDLHGVVGAVGGTLVEWKYVATDPRLAEARLTWKDPSIGTTSITRALVFRSAGAVTVASAECVLGPDAEALRAPCEAALASLRPQDAVVRIEHGLGAADPAGAATTTTTTTDATGATGGEEPAAGTGGAGSGGTTAPSMREGPDLPTTILVRPPPAQKDRRPLLLLAGVAVLAAVFLWNRRQRQRLEAAEARERKRAEARGKRRGRGDDEADDRDDAGDDAGDEGDDASDDGGKGSARREDA